MGQEIGRWAGAKNLEVDLAGEVRSGICGRGRRGDAPGVTMRRISVGSSQTCLFFRLFAPRKLVPEFPLRLPSLP
eukprot:1603967-Pleurochrysis_carterae.AAC.1